MQSLRKRQALFICIPIIFLASLTSGCVSLYDPESSQDSHSVIIGNVNPTRTLSQTFEIRRNGFNGLTLWLGLEDVQKTAEDGQLFQIDLYSYPEPLTLIHQATIKLENPSPNQAFSVSFPPQTTSSGKRYILRLSSQSGTVDVYGRNEDIYPLGQAYAGQQPLVADIAFSTTYDYNPEAFQEDLRTWLKNISLIPPLILILFLPGWLLLRPLLGTINFDLGQRIGISIGISLAITPVTLLWTSAIGISWSRTTILFFSGFLVAAWIYLIVKDLLKGELLNTWYHLFKNIKEIDLRDFTFFARTWLAKLGSPSLLISIFIFSLAVRLIMVRDLATPAWVDSVHHALITRIIIETGFMPENYLPYMDLESTYYHSGFHTQLATFQLLTQLDSITSMLIFGQVLNALIVIGVYAFAKDLTNSTITGLFAALITGLFSPMPAYYTSWGRYTQLSGLVILPAAYLLIKHAMISNRTKNRLYYSLLIAAVTAGGLFLVHYRVTAFLILLIFADLSVNFIFDRNNRLLSKSRFIPLLFFAFMVVLLVSPWLVRAIPNTFVPNLIRPSTGETRWFADFSWRYLSAALGKQALALGGLGLIWGLIRKKVFAFLLITWTALLLLFANLGVLGLPGGGLINTTSVEISLFIPISISAGYLISELIKSWKTMLPSKLHASLNLILVIAMIFVALVAAKNIVTVLNPVTFISRQADLIAIQWLDDHVDTDKAILINPFLWGYGLYAGYDGGAWITPLTGQITIPPPVLYTLASASDIEQINQISKFVVENGAQAEELHTYLKDKNIGYIYSGARGGSISFQALLDHPGFKSIYENQGVRIFEILP